MKVNNEADRFMIDAILKSGEDYGICPPPTDAQDAVNILCRHFLGDSWYVVMPLSADQCNTEIVYAIMDANPKRCNILYKVLHFVGLI